MMHLALEYCRFLATSAAGTSDLASLSDVELVRRFPAIAQVAACLFVIGLICDALLLVRLQRRRRAVQLFQIDYKPWGFHELGIATLGFVGLNLLLMIAGQAFVADGDLAWLFSLWGTLALNVVFLVTLVGYLRWRGTNWRELFGLVDVDHGRGALAGVLFYFAMIPPLAVITAIYAAICHAFEIRPTPQPVVELLTATDSIWVLGLVAGLAVVVAPVFEEVLFRGFAYPALKQRWGTWKALVAVSLAFATVHLHTPSAGPLFALGLAFAVAYELTGSLATPILMHALFNGANVLMLLYVRNQL